MALQIHPTKRMKGTTFRSGRIYKFKYANWRNDPEPLIIFMYAFSGTHPKTGREWRFFQAINFTYVPRSYRRLFATLWISRFGNATMYTRQGRNLIFDWERVKQDYPFLMPAVRRYFYTPNYLITDTREVPFQDWESAIMSTMSKDFSKKVRAALRNKYLDALGGFRRIKNVYRRMFGGRI